HRSRTQTTQSPHHGARSTAKTQSSPDPEAELAGVQDALGDELTLDAQEHLERRALLVAHETAELEAGAAVLAEHAGVLEVDARAGVPDLVVQLQSLGRVGGRVVDVEAVVDHATPRVPVREVRGVLHVVLSVRREDVVALRLVETGQL